MGFVFEILHALLIDTHQYPPLNGLLNCLNILLKLKMKQYRTINKPKEIPIYRVYLYQT